MKIPSQPPCVLQAMTFDEICGALNNQCRPFESNLSPPTVGEAAENDRFWSF